MPLKRYSLLTEANQQRDLVQAQVIEKENSYTFESNDLIILIKSNENYLLTNTLPVGLPPNCIPLLSDARAGAGTASNAATRA